MSTDPKQAASYREQGQGLSLLGEMKCRLDDASHPQALTGADLDRLVDETLSFPRHVARLSRELVREQAELAAVACLTKLGMSEGDRGYWRKELAEPIESAIMASTTQSSVPAPATLPNALKYWQCPRNALHTLEFFPRWQARTMRCKSCEMPAVLDYSPTVKAQIAAERPVTPQPVAYPADSCPKCNSRDRKKLGTNCQSKPFRPFHYSDAHPWHRKEQGNECPQMVPGASKEAAITVLRERLDQLNEVMGKINLLILRAYNSGSVQDSVDALNGIRGVLAEDILTSQDWRERNG